MKKIIVVIALIMLVPVLVSAQLKSQAKQGLDLQNVLKYGLNPLRPVSGLLDSDRFRIYQSYSLSLLSVNGHSFTRAMYLNTMEYQLADPLVVTLQWGYLMNQPFGAKLLANQPGSFFKGGMFVSNAQLRYAPSRNFQFILNYRSIPYTPYWMYR
ncbi:hypothetical protein J7K19_06835 [bacterium]|nr:hypothetical protein [bacterium]